MYDESPSVLPYSTITTVIDHLPPKFPIKQITTPIAIFYGSDDTLVDFDVLKAELPPLLAYVKKLHGWEHMDFLWARGLERKVFPDILRLLEKFNYEINTESNPEYFEIDAFAPASIAQLNVRI